MGRVKTFVNGGSFLPVDLNSIQDDYELGFAAYRLLASGQGRISPATSVDQMLSASGSANLTTATGYDFVHRFDPADHAAGARAVKVRLRFTLATDGTAPGVNLTAKLLPVTSIAAGVLTVGAALVATAALATPGANSLNTLTSADVTLTAGYYVFVVSPSAATSGTQGARVGLQLRQV